MVEKNKTRDLTIDYLKFIALIGLIIAHVSTNNILLQIRSFDVNLLIILSAFLCKKFYKNSLRKKDILKYYKKRFIRLVIPTWIFLSIYIAINTLGNFQSLTFIEILKTYLLMDSAIGYVWIIYVYMICAILMPLLLKVDISIKRNRVIIMSMFVLYIILYSVNTSYYFRIFILYPIIYGLISLLGLNWEKADKKFKYSFIFINIFIFIMLAILYYEINGYFVITGKYKYPPKIYYLSYTLGVSFALIEIFKNFHFKRCWLTSYVVFLSKSSLWFYLWHILTLRIAASISSIEFVQFWIVLFMTSIIVYIQNKLVDISIEKGFDKRIVCVFTG